MSLYIDILFVVCSYFTITLATVCGVLSFKAVIKPEPWEDGSDRVFAALIAATSLAGYAP